MGAIREIGINIIGGAATVAIIDGFRFIRSKMRYRSFRVVFGDNFSTPDLIHLVYAQLSLMPVIDVKTREPLAHPFRKPGEENSGTGFSIDHPVNSSEVRAAKYLAETIGKETKVSPALSADLDLKGRLDISFIAFGGPLSNFKSRDVLQNGGNNMVRFDNFKFIEADTGKEAITMEQGFDYGLILKIHPTQFPTRTWFACAGIGEWGTSGAAWYLAKRWTEIYDFAKGFPFGLIVRVRPGQDESTEVVYQVIQKDE
jgi:hypothetical protein